MRLTCEAVPGAVLMLLDGHRLVDPTAPLLRADDPGVLRGESVFETLRIGAGRPYVLDAHLARLAVSAARLAMDLPPGWAELALAATRAWGQPDGVLRLVCTKGGVGFALVTPIPAETVLARQGVHVVTLTLGVGAQARAAAPWLLGGVKSTSYAVNMASLRHAHELGADDVIWLSSDGEVLEAPTSTVCWLTGGRLVTPPTSVGVLAGTTLQSVLDLGLIEADVRRGTAQELLAADEVLLLSSIRGVAPVLSINGAAREAGPVGRQLAAALEASITS